MQLGYSDTSAYDLAYTDGYYNQFYAESINDQLYCPLIRFGFGVTYTDDNSTYYESLLNSNEG